MRPKTWLVFGISTLASTACNDALEEDGAPLEESVLAASIAGSYRLEVQNFRDCLRPEKAVATGGAITHGPCTTGALELTEKTSGGGIELRARDTTSCLAVEGRGTTNGVRIVFAACNGASEQQWVATTKRTSIRVFKSVLTGRCIDLPHRTPSTLQQWACDGSADQEFATQMTSAPPPTSGLRFPRLAGMLIGNPKNYDEPAYQAQVAKLDLAVLGMYEGWKRNGKSPIQATNEIRAKNRSIRLANYTIMTEVHRTTPTSATIRTKLSSEKGPGGKGDWWAYDAAGNHTDWSHGTYGAWDTNLTLLTTPDANGDRWPQWKARYDRDELLAGQGFDIWYCDNNFWRPRVDGDWNRDGVTDRRTDIKVQNWFRDGQRAYYDRAKALEPAMELMVNADNDLSGETSPSEAQPFTQFKRVLHLGFMEHAIGKDWSRETWAGFASTLTWYRELLANVIEPGGAMLDAFMPSPTDYRTARYALALTLLDDGYFSVSTDYNKVLWYDEFDLAGKGTTKWLGAAIDPPPTAPFQNGVWRRRFEHGMAIVNPKGNGARNVTIEAGYRRIAGNQATAVNSGARVTAAISLADRDGILLVKE